MSKSISARRNALRWAKSRAKSGRGMRSSLIRPPIGDLKAALVGFGNRGCGRRRCFAGSGAASGRLGDGRDQRFGRPQADAGRDRARRHRGTREQGMPRLRGRSCSCASAASAGATVLPVDSEHNAVFQALGAGARADVRRAILTASGGPFRTWSMDAIKAATPEQALRHPNWSMGPKVTVDSAT